jgi:hypothetical protein
LELFANDNLGNQTDHYCYEIIEPLFEIRWSQLAADVARQGTYGCKDEEARDETLIVTRNFVGGEVLSHPRST